MDAKKTLFVAALGNAEQKKDLKPDDEEVKEIMDILDGLSENEKKECIAYAFKVDNRYLDKDLSPRKSMKVKLLNQLEMVKFKFWFAKVFTYTVLFFIMFSFFTLRVEFIEFMCNRDMLPEDVLDNFYNMGKERVMDLLDNR